MLPYEHGQQNWLLWTAEIFWQQSILMSKVLAVQLICSLSWWLEQCRTWFLLSHKSSMIEEKGPYRCRCCQSQDTSQLTSGLTFQLGLPPSHPHVERTPQSCPRIQGLHWHWHQWQCWTEGPLGPVAHAHKQPCKQEHSQHQAAKSPICEQSSNSLWVKRYKKHITSGPGSGLMLLARQILNMNQGRRDMQDCN